MQGGPVGLTGTKIHALLLLSSAQSLAISLIEDVRVNLRVGEVLLLLQVCRHDARSIAAKSALHDGVAGLARHRLLVLLIQHPLSALKHRLDVGRHELADLLAANLLRVHRARARRCKAGGGHVVGLRRTLRACDVALRLLLQRLRGPEALHVLPGRCRIEGLRALIRLAVPLQGGLLNGRDVVIGAAQRAKRRAGQRAADLLGASVVLSRRVLKRLRGPKAACILVERRLVERLRVIHCALHLAVGGGRQPRAYGLRARDVALSLLLQRLRRAKSLIILADSAPLQRLRGLQGCAVLLTRCLIKALSAIIRLTVV